MVYLTNFTVPLVIKEFWRFLKSSGYCYQFITYYTVDLIFEVITAWLLAEISEGKTDYIIIFIILKTVFPLISDKFYSIITSNTKEIIELNFKEEGYQKYNKLSYESKNKTTPNDFSKKLNEACRAILMIIEWGFPNFLSVISAVLSCLIIFVKEDLYILGLVIILTNLIIYFKVIKKLQKDFTEGRENRKKDENRIHNIKTLYLPLFQYKEKTVKDMLNLDEKLVNNAIHNNKQWEKISLVTVLSNNIGIFLFGMFYSSTPVKLLLMLNTLQQFKNAVTNLMNFLNWFSNMEMEFNSYQNFWKELVFSSDPNKLNLPSSLEITKVNIIQDNFEVKFHYTVDNLVINQSDKILIKGKSGHGKTTFINALMGKIKGVTLSENLPENYYHHFVEFYQVIKEKMPSSAITVRQLFNNDQDDEFIKYCCEICKVYDFVSKLTPSKKKDNNDDEAVIIDIDVPNVLDIDIDERISGGQKTRLALATRIHRLLKEDKNILILDEPEQGSDPPLAYEILDNISQICYKKNITLIVISHLELIDHKITWNKKIKINEGLIYVN